MKLVIIISRILCLFKAKKFCYIYNNSFSIKKKTKKKFLFIIYQIKNKKIIFLLFNLNKKDFSHCIFNYSR